MKIKDFIDRGVNSVLSWGEPEKPKEIKTDDFYEIGEKLYGAPSVYKKGTGFVINNCSEEEKRLREFYGLSETDADFIVDGAFYALIVKNREKRSVEAKIKQLKAIQKHVEYALKIYNEIEGQIKELENNV